MYSRTLFVPTLMAVASSNPLKALIPPHTKYCPRRLFWDLQCCRPGSGDKPLFCDWRNETLQTEQEFVKDCNQAGGGRHPRCCASPFGPAETDGFVCLPLESPWLSSTSALAPKTKTPTSPKPTAVETVVVTTVVDAPSKTSTSPGETAVETVVATTVVGAPSKTRKWPWELTPWSRPQTTTLVEMTTVDPPRNTPSWPWLTRTPPIETVIETVVATIVVEPSSNTTTPPKQTATDVVETPSKTPKSRSKTPTTKTVVQTMVATTIAESEPDVPTSSSKPAYTTIVETERIDTPPATARPRV